MLVIAKRVVRSSSATRIFTLGGAGVTSFPHPAEAKLILSECYVWLRRGSTGRKSSRLAGLHGAGSRNRIGSFVLDVSREGTMRATAFRGPNSEDLREFFELSLNLWCIAGTDGYFKHLNPAWETTFGYSREELLASPYLDFVHPEDREPTIAAAGNVASGQSILSFENRYRCKDGSYKWLLWSAIARLEKGRIYAIAADVTDRKCQDARLAAQHAVTRVLAEAETLADATPRILEAVCKSLDWSVGAIWRTDQKTQLLCCVETWRMPAAQVSEFDLSTHAKTFPKGVGLPGRVWAEAQPQWIEDVTCDQNFPRAPIAA